MPFTRRGLSAGAFAALSLGFLAFGAKADPIHIGIAQWGRHPQLDAVNIEFPQRARQRKASSRARMSSTIGRWRISMHPSCRRSSTS